MLLLERGEPATYREIFVIVFGKDAKKGLASCRNLDESYVCKKVSGSTIVFLVLYVADISLVESDITVLRIVNLR